MKMEDERQEEDGRTKVFKFEFFVFHFLVLVPLRILFFGFGPSHCVTRLPLCQISFVCHITPISLPHIHLCNR